MSNKKSPKIALNLDRPIWDRFFTVNPLVVVGSLEQDGSIDLAPKHMAMPMGWQNFFGFMCTPAHATYQNIRRDSAFTVSFPYPAEVVIASLSASPRCEDNTKPLLETLPTVPARNIEGVFLRDAYLQLECRLHRIIDDFGPNSLITGRIIGAFLDETSRRMEGRDDNELLYENPLLAYLSPGRFAEIRESQAFPFPKDIRY